MTAKNPPSYPEASQNPDKRMGIYSQAKAAGNKQEMDSLEDIPLAMENVVSKHSDPKMSAKKLDPPPYPEAAEVEWNEALQNLDKRMRIYYSRAKAADNKEEMDNYVEDIALAMEDVASRHPDPKVQKEYRTKAQKLRNSTSDKREGILEDIGKGLLILLTTPFFLVGTALQAADQILRGVGSILRGLGKLAKKPRDLVG